MTMTLTDAERLFGLSWRDGADKMKSTYRRLLMRHHPDRGGREADIKPINEAYEILRRSFEKRDASLMPVMFPWQAAAKLTLDEGKRFAALMGEPWFSFAESLAPIVSAFWGIKAH